MDQKTVNQIKDFVSDNELEKALDLLIGKEQNKGQERHNTLILLKGKLDMLEEQEMAGLLDFDELARQKGRIAHSILKMTEGTVSATEPIPTKRVEVQKTASSSIPIFKYLFFGLLIVAVAAGIFFMKKTNSKPAQPAKDLTDKTETPKEQPSKTPENEKNTLTIDPNKIPDRTKDRISNISKIKDAIKDEKTTANPVVQLNTVRLSGFPTLNRAFNFSDIKYIFTNAKLERFKTDHLKLTLGMGLYCRNNLGHCEREETFIIVDGKKVKPISQKNRTTMDNQTKAKDELVFVFSANANSYQIQLMKNRSDWTRSFKVLK